MGGRTGHEDLEVSFDFHHERPVAQLSHIICFISPNDRVGSAALSDVTDQNIERLIELVGDRLGYFRPNLGAILVRTKKWQNGQRLFYY
jgi:hypothetical protein